MAYIPKLTEKQNPLGLVEKPIVGYPGCVMLENRMVFNYKTGYQYQPFFMNMKMMVQMTNKAGKRVNVDLIELHERLFGSKRKGYQTHFYRELKRFEEMEIWEMYRAGVDFKIIRKKFCIYNPSIERVIEKYQGTPDLNLDAIQRKLQSIKNENQSSEGEGHHQ